MADWLMLRLPARADAPVSWVVADAAGQLRSMPSQDDGGGLQTVAVGKRIALLVPAGEVTFFEVALPAGNEARLLQLAPFALEDQLSQDLDELHFAVGPRDAASGLVPVAVTEREQMRRWLARAAELQLLPQAVHAESDLAPVLPGHVTMLVADDQLLLRNDTARPLVLPATDPSLALDMLLGDPAAAAQINLTVIVGPGDWQKYSKVLEPLRERVASFKVQLNSGGVIAQLAQGLAHGAPINLLQGEFRPRNANAGSWRQWRWAAGLAAALLLLHVGGSAWQLHKLRRDSAALDAQIAQLYASIFPGQVAGSEPRRVLERRLAAIAGGDSQQGELLHLLAAVAAAKQNVPVAQLQSFSFKPGSMQMRLTAPDATTLEQFNQALRGSGYHAEITAGTVKGSTYEGQIELRNPGA